MVDAAARRRRLPADRRLGRVPQRPAAQGHPPGDEVGDAGGGDDLRRRCVAGDADRRRGWRTTSAGCARAGPARSCGRCATSTRRSSTAPSAACCRPASGCSPAGAAGDCSTASATAPGHEHLRPLERADGAALRRRPRRRCRSTARSPSTSSPTSTTRPPRTRRTSRSTCWSTTPTSASTAARPSTRNPCQRFCPAAVYEMVDGPGGADGPPAADQRLELRALQDLRHHGPLPDHHLGAARGRRRPELLPDVGRDTVTES